MPQAKAAGRAIVGSVIVLLAMLILVAFVVMAAAKPAARRSMPTPAEPSDESPIELADRDPVEVLLRYGTPETAEHLRQQSIDLGALGYRDGAD